MSSRRNFLQAALALGMMPACPVRAAGSLRLAYMETYAPFSFRESGVLRGIFIDIFDEVIVRRLGVPVEHKGYPWARAQLLVQQGEHDGLCSVITPARLEYALAATEAVLTVPVRVFARKDHRLLPQLAQARSVDDLRRLNLVVVSYRANGWTQSHMREFKIESGNDLDASLKMLIAGRGDITVAAPYAAQYRLRQIEGGEQIQILPQALDHTDFNLMLGKQSPHRGLLPAFDKAMRQYKQSADYRAIFQKYGVQR